MIRRQFLQRVASVGAAGLAGLGAGCARDSAVVVFLVKGFTCVTCATGLETLLARERGVLSVVASYPEGRTRITFDPSKTTSEALAESIRQCGFTPGVLRP